MILGGLWHGANWTFVIWGTLHGLGVSATHVLRRMRWTRSSPHWLSVLITFHFVTVTWAFFRAPSASRAVQMLSGPFTGSWGGFPAFLGTWLFPLVLIGVFFLVHPFDDQRRVKLIVRRWRPEVLWPVLIFLWIMAITVSQGSSAKFVYFDF
jgi:alginate O-acetyltransferase complex protein AlgI